MIVIKFGGHAMSDSTPEWIAELADRWRLGEKFVLVHGGGPAIDQQLIIEGTPSEFVDGNRVTTSEVMKVVEYVLTGTVLRSVVRMLSASGVRAVGITGSDANLLSVRIKADGRFGLVGEVERVDPTIILDLLNAGYLPVISPVSNNRDGVALNINADLAAGKIAGSLEADQMIFITDVPGIYRNWPDKSSLIASIDIDELGSMRFEKGMIPKVSAAISAIESGARSVRIIGGSSSGAFKDALAGKGGTWVKR